MEDVPVPRGVASVSRLPNKSKAGAVVFSLLQLFAITAASIDPKPVTRSYPGPALTPYWAVPVVGQSFVPAPQGTMLLPDVMSWNALAVLAASAYRVGFTLPCLEPVF